MSRGYLIMNEKIIQVVSEEITARGNPKQEVIAEICGVSQPTISRLLRGKQDISLDSLRKIYNGFDLPFLLDLYDRQTLINIKAAMEISLENTD